MTYRGRVENGVVIFDGSQKPPDGTAVEVAIVTPTSPESLAAALLEFSGVIKGLPPDMAERHDHYIHGRSSQ